MEFSSPKQFEGSPITPSFAIKTNATDYSPAPGDYRESSPNSIQNEDQSIFDEILPILLESIELKAFEEGTSYLNAF